MKSNFDFLKGCKFYPDLLLAEKYTNEDAGSCATKIRLVIQSSVNTLYENFQSLSLLDLARGLGKSASYLTIYDKLNNEEFEEFVDNKTMYDSIFELNRLGNKGAHSVDFKENNLIKPLEKLHTYLKWFSFENLEVEILAEFDPLLVPTPETEQEEIDKLVEEKAKIIEEQKARDLKLFNEQEALVKQEEEANKLLLAKVEKENTDVNYTSVGITELMGLIWGRVYLNYTYLGEKYYAIKHFRNEDGAKEKLKIGKGDYENNSLYSMFTIKHPNLSKEEILNGKHDNSFNLAGSFPKRYSTPSLLLKKLISQVELHHNGKATSLKLEKNNIELAENFQFKGHYYKNEGSKFRNILEIEEKGTLSSSPYQLIVVMLNPGGSRPLSFEDSCWGDSPALNHGVECKPDDTQYQIVKLMKMKGWKKAVVLNLFDKCNVNSGEVIEHYTTSKNKKEHLKESVFHEDRREELDSIFNLSDDKAPIVIGWGVNNDLLKIKKAIFNKVLVPTKRNIVGWKKEDCQFYHPWPREREDIRNGWQNVVFKQFNN